MRQFSPIFKPFETYVPNRKQFLAVSPKTLRKSRRKKGAIPSRPVSLIPLINNFDLRQVPEKKSLTFRFTRFLMSGG